MIAKSGRRAGTYGLTIESNCTIAWDLVGTYAGTGADYNWSADLTVNDGATDCGGAEDTDGALTASGGSAYFNGAYIGTASYTANSMSWATAGYVTGGSGGSYAYDGTISW